MGDRLTQIDQNIKEAEEEIRSLESQIDDNERAIRRWKGERDELQHTLHLDLCSTGDA